VGTQPAIAHAASAGISTMAVVQAGMGLTRFVLLVGIGA